MYSAPNSVLGQVKDLLGEFGLSGSFKVQPLDANASQIKIQFEDLEIDFASLVTAISKTRSTFELEIEGDTSERYLHHPSLGICRNELDLAGEVMLRAGQLEHLMMETGGNISEFARGFRRLAGVPWLDLIEPYRKTSEYLLALPRAV